MIRLIRACDSLEILLNASAIRSYREDGAKTLITLCDGECVEVKNDVTDVMEKIDAWQKGLADDQTPAQATEPQDL